MSKQGFSLLELSVVLAIISVIVASGLTLGTAKTQQTKISTTYEEMKEISEAISVYVNKHGCLPHPETPIVAPTSASYGRETNANCAATGGTGAAVILGGVPFYALGLPDEYGSDAWNSRYTYAITDTAAEAITSSYTGAITVNDNNSNLISSEVTYVIISHGKTRKGGATVKTANVVACDSTAPLEKDSENCDGDTVYIDGTYNDGDVDLQYYDDILLWKTTDGIYEYGAGGGGGASSGISIPTGFMMTTLDNDGDFSAFGSPNYQGIQNFARANGCDANTTVCTVGDITRYALVNGYNDSALTVVAGHIIPEDAKPDAGLTNDCHQYTTDASGPSVSATFWDSSQITKTNCDNAMPVLCCQWD